MSWQKTINPGADHTTIVEFHALGPNFQTFSMKKAKGRKGKPRLKRKESKKGKDEKKVSGELGEISISVGDGDWDLPFPGFIAPKTSVVIRSFESLPELLKELPAIAAGTQQIMGSHDARPTVILRFPHRGPLDATDIKVVGESLKPAKIHAVLVVSHEG